jgi:hypothetical protein
MRALVLALAVSGVLVAVGCGGEGEPAASDSTTMASRSGEAGEKRRKAPPIAGTTLEGDRISLASFAERPVLINVWSSW